MPALDSTQTKLPSVSLLKLTATAPPSTNPSPPTLLTIAGAKYSDTENQLKPKQKTTIEAPPQITDKVTTIKHTSSAAEKTLNKTHEKPSPIECLFR